MAQPFVEPCSRGLIAAEPCPRELGREIAPARRRLVLSACILASAMAFIDGSALTVALPALRAAFDADLATVQWVLNGYVVALASLTLIGGALADVHGKARILLLGCLLFGLASAACALAPSAAWLIAARVVQGIAAALLTPASLALIGAVYPKEERNQAIGVWAAASALTTAGGPVLGGWLTQVFGWQSIFWINPPFALAAAGLLAAFAPPDQREARRFDIVGAAILAASLAALAFALSQIDAAHATMRGAELAAVAVSAVIGIGLYVAWERRSAHPMTPPRLAHNAPFVGLNLATLLVYAGLSVMFFVLPFELVERRRLTPTDAGLVFLPFTLGVGVLARFFGGLADRIGARTMLITGPVGAALAYVWMALARDASLLAAVVVPMTLLGVSFAVLIAPLTASVMSSVASADEGLASGINNAISRVAQLIGVALAAGVAALAIGYPLSLIAAAVLSLAGAGVVAARVPPAPQDRSPPTGSTS
jgi:EmrB/QacA subfamily drug resistance transporter